MDAICVRPPDRYCTAVRENEPATGKPEKKGRGHVGVPERLELLVGVDLVVLPGRDGLGDGDGLYKADEGHDQGGGRQRADGP